jgi:hypothetical protein
MVQKINPAGGNCRLSSQDGGLLLGYFKAYLCQNIIEYAKNYSLFNAGFTWFQRLLVPVTNKSSLNKRT